jgi:hypothetical protein
VSPSDYAIELRVMVGHGPALVWVISKHDQVRHVFSDEPLAMRVVRELARLEHCDAWLVDDGVAPVRLTARS